jgi:hypothetical protein
MFMPGGVGLLGADIDAWDYRRRGVRARRS